MFAVSVAPPTRMHRQSSSPLFIGLAVNLWKKLLKKLNSKMCNSRCQNAKTACRIEIRTPSLNSTCRTWTWIDSQLCSGLLRGALQFTCPKGVPYGFKISWSAAVGRWPEIWSCLSLGSLWNSRSQFGSTPRFQKSCVAMRKHLARFGTAYRASLSHLGLHILSFNCWP